MTVQPVPAKKTPWLMIVLGVLAVLCLCAIVIGVAIFALFIPTSVSTTVNEAPSIVIPETDSAPSTSVPFEATPEGASPSVANLHAAPAGSAVEIGNDMTLTVLDVTRPADDIVANGSAMNTSAPAGEEFMQVDVRVACDSKAGSQCTFYPTVMKAFLSDGSTRDLQTFLEGVDDWDTAVEIEGGGTREGFLLFIVPESDSDLLSYNDIYADQPLYMELP